MDCCDLSSTGLNDIYAINITSGNTTTSGSSPQKDILRYPSIS